MEYNKAATGLGNLAAQQQYAGQAQAASEAENVLCRLRDVRSKLSECVGMSKVACDKIIGSTPEAIRPGEGKPASTGPTGFLYTISSLIGEIDGIGSEIAEQLSRLHRAF